MRSIHILAVLATLAVVASVDYDAKTAVVSESEPVVALYAGSEVPEYLEPVFSWPPGSLVDCGECRSYLCDQNKHAFYNLYGFDSPVDRSYGEPTHLCWHEVYSDGTCPQKHPQGGMYATTRRTPRWCCRTWKSTCCGILG